MRDVDIPLFPLSTVLFPGGRLSLRIFERRYLDLVRDCTRGGGGFGVCLILEGHEAGEPAVPAAVGTFARIVDFHSLPDGLLGIVAEGGECFQVAATRVRGDGLVHGQVRFREAEPSLPVPPEYGLLATILERLHEKTGDVVVPDRSRYDDASWVGFRLAEALPLALPERQELLQLADPLGRLARIAQHIPRFQRG